MSVVVGTTPPIVPPADDTDFVTSASIFSPMQQVVNVLDSHMAGRAGSAGSNATNHDDTMINVGVTLPETATAVQNPGTQRVYNDSTWQKLSGLLGYGGSTGFIAKATAAAADMVYSAVVALLRQHSHASNSSGGQLYWSNTHLPTGGAVIADADLGPGSYHHTLGTTANQAAAGNHVHTGPQTYTGTSGPALAALTAKNASGDPAQAILAVQNNAGTTNILSVGPGSAAFTVPVSSTGAISATGGFTGNLTGNVTGTATGVTAGAITNAMMATNSVATGNIQDGAVTGGTGAGAKIAASTVTSANIVDGTITGGTGAGADIAVQTIRGGGTSGNIAAATITATEMAALSIATGALQDNAVTGAKILDGTVGASELSATAVTNAAIVDNTISGLKLQRGTVPTDRLSEGAVRPEGGTLNIVVAATRTWTNDGLPVNFTGGTFSMASFVPGTLNQWCYVLVSVNGTATPVVFKQGTLTMGGLVDGQRPLADPNSTPLAYVGLYGGMTQIADGDLWPWRGPQPFTGAGPGGTGFAAVSHDHGTQTYTQVSPYGLKEGFVHPTSVASKSVLVEQLHYPTLAGIVQTTPNQTTLPPSGVPFDPPASAGQVGCYRIYLDRNAAGLAVSPKVDLASKATPRPAFNIGPEIPLAYVLTRVGMNSVLNIDDNTNGWIEDARTWQGGSSGLTAAAGYLGVSQGGTGVQGFAQGLVWQANGTTPTTPLAVIPADTNNGLAGLSIEPSVPSVGASQDIDVQVLGGGSVQQGSVSLNSLRSLHIVAPVIVGSGTIANKETLRVDAATGGTNNAAAILAGNVRVGGGTAPTNALSVTGAADVSGLATLSAGEIAIGASGVPAVRARNATGDPAQNILAVQNNAGSTSFLTVSPAQSVITNPLAVSGSGTITNTGAGQASLTPSSAFASIAGASLGLNDTGAASYNGGYILMGASGAAHGFAGIKAAVLNGTANSTGDLLFGVHDTTADTTLVEHFRIRNGAGQGALVTGNLAGTADAQFNGVTTFPGAASAGQTCYRADLNCWYKYDGTANWRQMGIPMFTTASRPATNVPQEFRYTDLTDRFTYRNTSATGTPTYVRASNSVMQLNWNETATSFSAFTSPASTPKAISSTLNFNVDDANSIVEINVRASVLASTGGTAGQPQIIAQVDGAYGFTVVNQYGMPSTTYWVNGSQSMIYGPAGAAGNISNSLAVGSHSMYLYYICEVATTIYFLPPSAFYECRVRVIERKP